MPPIASRSPDFRLWRQAALLAGSLLVLGGCASYPPAPAPVTTVGAPQLAAGDRWVYEQINPYNHSHVRTLTETLEPVALGYKLVKHSDRDRDPAVSETYPKPWFMASESGGSEARDFYPPLELVRFPLQPGSKWRQTIHVTGPARTYIWFVDAGAMGWETVSTPAGSFKALKIVLQMDLGDGDWIWRDRRVTETLWYAPDVKRWVRREYRSQRANQSCIPRWDYDWKLWELHSYHLNP
jgi:hypothetical protein